MIYFTGKILTFLYAKHILNQIVSIHEIFFVSKP
jgi:hypothetical protein